MTGRVDWSDNLNMIPWNSELNSKYDNNSPNSVEHWEGIPDTTNIYFFSSAYISAVVSIVVRNANLRAYQLSFIARQAH